MRPSSARPVARPVAHPAARGPATRTSPGGDDASWLSTVEANLAAAVADARSAVSADALAQSMAARGMTPPGAVGVGAALHVLVREGRLRTVRPPDGELLLAAPVAASAAPPASAGNVSARDRQARESTARRANSRPRGTAARAPLERRVAYYTTLTGPTWIRADALCDVDRRRHAVRCFWRATGRPFTTAAVRLYARDTLQLSFECTAPTAWTNALQHLARMGELVRVQDGRAGRFCRWAPAAAWARLSAAEQRHRLEDTRRGTSPRGRGARDGEIPSPPIPAAGGDASSGPRIEHPIGDPRPHGIGETSPHDVAFASQNRDIRALVIQAAAARTTAVSNEIARERPWIAERPVTRPAIEQEGARWPHLLPQGVSLARALYEASRRRPGMVRPTLVRVELGPRRTYYAVPTIEGKLSPAAEDFLRCERALLEAGAPQLRLAMERLREAQTQDAAGAVPIGGYVLAARAEALATCLQRVRGAVAAAEHGAALLPEERAALADHARTLNEWVAILDPLLDPRLGTASPARAEATPVRRRPSAHGAPAGTPVIDVAVAWAQIEEYAPYELASPRLLRNRLIHAVPSVRCRDARSAGGGPAGRTPEMAFDRFAFGTYATSRWGGATLQVLAAQARHAAGTLRDETPFIATLAEPRLVRAHRIAAAALGFFDTPSARAALCRYVTSASTAVGAPPSARVRDAEHRDHAAVASTESAGGVSGAALVAALYGLAPKPFGGAATVFEREASEATELARTGSADPFVRALAGRVRAAWEERWDRRRLCFL